MLLGAITVLVVVTASDPAAQAGPRDATTRAMERALRSALGRDAVVAIRKATGESDEQLLSWASGEHANLLGVVTWSEEQKRVTLRFVHPSEGRWADREIRFDAADAPQERGRTVGFALASMVPDDAIPPPPPEPAPAPSPPPAPPPPAAIPATEGGSEAGSASAPSVPRPPTSRTSIDAAVTAAAAVEGFGGGLGGSVALRYAVAGPLALRIGVGARLGDVAPAQATSRVYLGAVGVAWQPWLGSLRRIALGGRLDLLALGHELVHLSADDPGPDSALRLVPGGAAAIEGLWRFADQAAFIGSAGAELAFGRTDVVVRQRLVAELVPVRVFGEAGVRVWF